MQQKLEHHGMSACARTTPLLIARAGFFATPAGSFAHVDGAMINVPFHGGDHVREAPVALFGMTWVEVVKT
jgi:hypothetical protein